MLILHRDKLLGLSVVDHNNAVRELLIKNVYNDLILLKITNFAKLNGKMTIFNVRRHSSQDSTLIVNHPPIAFGHMI